MLLLKKLWREMIERKGAASKILTVCDYKRVDEMEGDGGKIEVVLVIIMVVLVILMVVFNIVTTTNIPPFRLNGGKSQN